MKPIRPLIPEMPENCAFKLIGLGGVGSIVARYLALFLASQNRSARLVLVDGDAFEPGNGSRMIFARFGNKAAVVRDELLERCGETLLSILACQEFVTPASADKLLHENDVVLLCVDNHATRKLVSRHCTERLQNFCLISAGNDGVGNDSFGRYRRGTYGNVQIHRRREGIDLSPSIETFHPEIENPPDHIPGEAGCAEMMLSVPQILFTNLMTASSMLNALFLSLCGALHYSELCFDLYEGLMRPMEYRAPEITPSAEGQALAICGNADPE